MQITGMLHGARLLQFAGFPATEVLGPAASEDEIRGLIDRYGQIFIKRSLRAVSARKARLACSAVRRI